MSNYGIIRGDIHHLIDKKEPYIYTNWIAMLGAYPMPPTNIVSILRQELAMAGYVRLNGVHNEPQEEWLLEGYELVTVKKTEVLGDNVEARQDITVEEALRCRAAMEGANFDGRPIEMLFYRGSDGQIRVRLEETREVQECVKKGSAISDNIN